MGRLTVVALLLVVVACGSTRTITTKGAVCVAEREIALMENPNPLTTETGKDMVSRTVDSIRPGEMYEVADTYQATDANTGQKTGPKYLKLRSKTRPQVVGWAWATPIRATLVE
jgi:hypothetical protein